MSDEIKCTGCGCEIGKIVNAEEDEAAKKLPSGLAVNTKKILQVNMQEEDGEHYAIFEYYTEYGMEGVTLLRIIESPTGECYGPYDLPVKALTAFVDHFRKELST